jgi:hypothetical protein
MNARERFNAVCSFELKNSPFFFGMPAWPETYSRWVQEGMPVRDKEFHNLREANRLLVGMENRVEWLPVTGAIGGKGKNGYAPWIVALDPLFEREEISRNETHVVLRDWDGTIVEHRIEDDQSIPRYLSYPVTDKASWKEYKKRLEPLSEGRWKPDWMLMKGSRTGFPHPAVQEGLHFSNRDFPLGMNLMSLYGNPRNYMGVENLSLAIYDDFDLVLDMLDWQAHMAYAMAQKLVNNGIVLDFAWIWEDMCFNKGPLVSPAFVKEFLAPRYRKVIDLLYANGTRTFMVDCDGNIDLLLPIWIVCGINATYPLECASGMDARQVRKKNGHAVVLAGNVDKRALAQGKREIDGEVDKVREMISGGGYFVGPDHHIPPDVSWENACYFISEVNKLE